MAILNAVQMGSFLSDRSIAEYGSAIWKVSPFHVGLVDYGELGSDDPSGKLTCKLSQYKIRLGKTRRGIAVQCLYKPGVPKWDSG